MKKIRAIIVDDEHLARKGIKKLLEPEENIEILSECENGEEAVIAINNLLPDLVFLDIQMPELNGFGVLDRINLQELPAIIFITAYDQYAIKAFEVNVIDYLLKPFSDSRFKTALDRAVKQINDKQVNSLSRKIISLINDHNSTGEPFIPVKTEQDKYVSRIIIRESGEIRFVEVKDIIWFEAAGYYVNIHTADSEYLIRKSLKKLEDILNPEQFFRIHRSAIVKINEIKSIVPAYTGDYKVLLKNSLELKMSRTRKHFLDKFFK